VDIIIELGSQKMFYDDDHQPHALSLAETLSSWVFALALITIIMVAKGFFG